MKTPLVPCRASLWLVTTIAFCISCGGNNTALRNCPPENTTITKTGQSFNFTSGSAPAVTSACPIAPQTETISRTVQTTQSEPMPGRHLVITSSTSKLYQAIPRPADNDEGDSSSAIRIKNGWLFPLSWDGETVSAPAGTPGDQPSELELEELEVEMPNFTPWPPATASARMVLPRELLGKVSIYRDIDRKLSNALNKCGYVEKSYYAVPGGFAIATQVEQFESDGTPAPDPYRWCAKIAPLRHFSIEKYIALLVKPISGHFRIIVFIMSSRPFGRSQEKISLEEASEWCQIGFNQLPSVVGRKALTEDHVVTTLVYEFEKSSGYQTQLIIPSPISCQAHLEKAGIISAIALKEQHDD